MCSACSKFIQEEAKELSQLIDAKELELGRCMSAKQKNDLLISFITEHDGELASHALETLTPEEAASLRT